MAEEVRLAKADLKRSAEKPAVTMYGLWRLMLWGSTAATAMLVAVLAGRGVVGSQRAAVALSTLGAHPSAAAQLARAPGAPAFDTATETKQLTDAMQELTAENDQLRIRVAAVEHSLDDVTGSIAQQAKKTSAADAGPPASTTPPWPENGPPVPVTSAAIAAVVAPALPMPMEYAVDIGSAPSIQALRARWAGIRSAHPQLFAGMSPTVSLSEVPPSNHPELRLVLGPLVSADAATQLCKSLERFRLACQPTIFAGQHLALE